MANDDKLQLIFDPRTIGDLGIKTYTQLPPALNELISNAYDAGANDVTISITQETDRVEKIEVRDNGTSMDRQELQNCFLIVGRKRRQEGGDTKLPGGRKITGRKGLGNWQYLG